MTLYSYNWSVDLGASLNRELVRLVKWQNARAHVVHCLLNQKMGLFHHYCFADAPVHEMDSKQVEQSFKIGITSQQVTTKAMAEQCDKGLKTAV